MEKEPREVQRIEKLRSKIPGDYFLLNGVSCLRYFTGFNAHKDTGFALINPEGRNVLVTDGRYKEQVDQEVDQNLFEIDIWTPSNEKPSYLSALKDIFSPAGSFRLHHEEEELKSKHRTLLEEFWPNAEIVGSSDVPLHIRAVKDAGEIALIKKSIEILESTLAEVFPLVKVGISECDIAAEISYRFKKKGATKEAFELQVLAGDHSVLPHGVASERIIQQGDLLQFDIGCVYQGYCSDVSRVVMVGAPPTKKQQEVYGLVYTIQQEIISRLKPGIKSNGLFLEHVDMLEKAGFSAIHGLGHGFGLDIHELPTLSRKAEHTLEAGNTITIEPGVYLSGKWGIRLEEDVLITNEEPGHVVLTSFSNAFIALDY